MKVFIVLGLLVSAVMSQEILEVTCGQDAITAKFEKKVAETANYQMEDLHFTDPDCIFDEDTGDYYIKRIEPLTSCGTETILNDTHVTFINSISSGEIETGKSYPHGIIVGQPSNNQLISVSLRCTYLIDLRVSAAFIPNITYVFIEIPDAVELGQFKVGMAIYRTGAYRSPHTEKTPILDAEETVYVGVSLIGDTSSDVFLLLKRCWATVFEDPDSDPYYDLIEDECPISDAVKGTVRVTQNGDRQQALWQTEVFKFIGSEEAFNMVWLHCDVTLCIKKTCKPSCDDRRRRRSADEPDVETKIVTFGPIQKLDITVLQGEEGYAQIVIVNETIPQGPGDLQNNFKTNPGMNSSLLAIIGALAGFCLLFLSVALIIVVVRLTRANRRNGEVTTTGTINKGFSI